MKTFSTLFKYELKKQFPLFSRAKKEKGEVVGFLLSLIVTLAIVGMFVYFLSVITTSYVHIKIDKVLDAKERAYELLNLLYAVVLSAIIFISLESMRKAFTDATDKKVLLRLPVKERTLFLSKFAVLLLKICLSTWLMIVPINIIIYIALMPSAMFWLSTVFICLVFPLLAFLFASILIVPYIKTIDFLKNKYLLVFMVFTILIGALILFYTTFLGLVQSYLETGHIKFLFNETFILVMQKLTIFTYPSNCLAGIVVGKDLLKSFLIVLGLVGISVFVVYWVTKKLYYITLYKDENVKVVCKEPKRVNKLSVMSGLLKKEFISVCREPKHIFSYLVIAAIMPILVYCCYTLFETLILNILGIKIPLALALFVTLICGVLTNTFCSTNMSREGTTLQKQKTFPIKATQLLTAKVVFCLIISVISVILSSILLIVATSLNVWDGMFCLFIALMFSVAQILIATRLDLSGIKMSYTHQQIEQRSSSTVAKVVIIGLIISLLAGIATLIVSILSKSVLTSLNVNINSCFVYIIPLCAGVVYLGFAILYYLRNLEKTLEKIAM